MRRGVEVAHDERRVSLGGGSHPRADGFGLLFAHLRFERAMVEVGVHKPERRRPNLDEDAVGRAPGAQAKLLVGVEFANARKDGVAEVRARLVRRERTAVLPRGQLRREEVVLARLVRTALGDDDFLQADDVRVDLGEGCAEQRLPLLVAVGDVANVEGRNPEVERHSVPPSPPPRQREVHHKCGLPSPARHPSQRS